MVPDAAALEAAVLSVPGVAAVALAAGPVGAPPAPGDPGLGLLQLTLEPGADEAEVARAVDRLVRDRFGLGVDPSRVGLVEEAEPERRLRAVPNDPLAWPPPAAPEPAAPIFRPSPTPSAAAPAPAQVEPEEALPEAPPPAAAEGPPAAGARLELPLRPRLLIRRLQVAASGLGVSVAVTLGLDDDDLVGTAEGPTTTAGVHRAVAEATAHAVQAAVERRAGDALPSARVRLDIEGLDVPVINGVRVAVVQVTLTASAGSERLTGASEVRDDVRQAVVRATLDALNRRLETLLAVR